MTEYGSRWSQQPANVNFEPIIGGLKSVIFDWDQVWNLFHICNIQLQKKNGVKNGWKLFVPLRGGKGAGRRFMAIKSFQFVFIGPESDHCLPLSLTHSLTDSLTAV